MINLLPEEEKILIKREYTRRLVVVNGIFLFILVCSAVILLLPSYLPLSSQKQSFESQLDAAKQGLSREKADETESSIRRLNDKLAFFSQQGEDTRQISVLIKQILSVKSPSVKLWTFTYQEGTQEKKNEQISIQGIATTRNIFLAFAKTLEAVNGVSEVQFPPANLMKDENVEFSLTLKLVPMANPANKQ